MLAKCTNDPRRSSSITHQAADLLNQLIFKIDCCYEIGNDSDSLRKVHALKKAVCRLTESQHDLASRPKCKRLEKMLSIKIF